MSLEFLVIIFLIIGSIGIFFFLFNKKLTSLQHTTSDPAIVEWLKTMQQSLSQTNATLNEAMRTSSTDMTKVLQENSRQLNERLDKAATVIKNVGEEVGKMSEIGRSMQELQALLKSPKLRGNIGEHILKELLTEIFPKRSFFLQYTFHSGEKVDAAIKTDAGILPIDAKFPMENFQKMNATSNDLEKQQFTKDFVRDVKKHIDAISKKYILPQEGTMDFALMYIPSESIFYEIVNMTELVEYARRLRVYVVSPSTLYVHLQTILLSFEGKKIESRSQEILKLIKALHIDYEKITLSMNILGKHIGNASTQYQYVTKNFTTFGQKLHTTDTLPENEEILPLSEPEKVIL